MKREIRDEEIRRELEQKIIITKWRRIKWFIWSVSISILIAFCFLSLYNRTPSIPELSFLIPWSLFIGLGCALTGPRFENLVILARASIKYRRENRLKVEEK
jgi:uncharacterized integral membrane protein